MKACILFFLLCTAIFPFCMATVEKTAGALTVDGELDEPSWQAAGVLSDFLFPWGGESRGTITHIKLLYDDSAFYISGTLLDDQIIELATAVHGIPNMYRDDMVETHIAPDTANADYFYLLECNARGPINTQFRNSYPSGRNKWNEVWDTLPGLRRAFVFHGTANILTDVDTSWTFEFRIPWLMLSGWQVSSSLEPQDWNPAVPPVPGSVWRYNINRLNTDKPSGGVWNVDYEHSIWSHNGNYPYGTPDSTGESSVHFHDQNNFGRLTFGYTVDIEEAVAMSDEDLVVEAVPNPFNPQTKITITNPSTKLGTSFKVPASPAKRGERITNIELKIFNVQGKLVKELIPDISNSIVWDASAQPSGIYMAQIRVGEKILTKRLVLVK
ncbi:MAG: hypothetical protein A2268_12550 [Candidatus Raymondbacteria bacterium RifOxyA12_full_50_37]|uniref:Secretion system C-terminal sorting domain-containing protein n=1 Tax=Candidatus Raymondbacteria bacterium RIFOXYD12_FULL_49_13 TaxID=1817890 RepID=A0A1F7FAP6_UNCRA|nr:MAG: hypothetical protein A2268_12550 [Candidatus Raymondbacteria bacterium RifOxyA12_full_50_37]OGJ91006.1 MAG: hypothetical protein A2248_00570 [Candidatus Raymondbacteria bacterium RIFOXYA2_FULL_49_16]OGJ97443.1 MAG: hypothetical protein A2453_10120 [Candidatus Raymondbacteria bacterium RIFOXYC2_FULL_50_21]OGK01762.1 MAG: hypothetical protein A2350_17570 [Candidatus Raymondbacteria bacterium RifOxyB12_full_50_8]OGK03587.1 MAG: hypothetical protein A2519_11775 [Candidatus Raymondbacteria b